MDSSDSDVPLFANLDHDTPAVLDAVNEARRTFPQFAAAVTNDQYSEGTHLIKVPFIDRSKQGKSGQVYTPETAAKNRKSPTCHLWLRVTSILDDSIFCEVFEAPEELGLEQGDSFVIENDTIEDWMIISDGTAFGGFSLRLIRSKLSTENQKLFDAHTGISEFRDLTS